jgi:hypothetical protein
LKFLRERTLDEARVEEQVGPGITGQRPGPIISLSLDTTNTFFKVNLHCTLTLASLSMPDLFSVELNEVFLNFLEQSYVESAMGLCEANIIGSCEFLT